MAKNEGRIKDGSLVPKYLQVIQAFTADIEQGLLKPGQRLPSINETSEKYYLSRDTVEKAYAELRERGLIEAVKGRGHFVSQTASRNKVRVLLLFNKLSASKKAVYYGFLKALGEQATVDLHIHHSCPSVLRGLIAGSLGHYHHYVVMPHFYEGLEESLRTLQMIPRDKLMLLDKDLQGLEGDYAAVFQDFEEDIFTALHAGIDLLRKYRRLALVFPADVRYPLEIRDGFRRFCLAHSFAFRIIGHTCEEPIVPGEAFVVLEETDLVNLIKRVSQQGLRLGQEVGILSYNETPLKEILADGITVISTDHVKMGERAAEMILGQSRGKVRNPFRLIRRNSL